jgi:hypothetical protein
MQKAVETNVSKRKNELGAPMGALSVEIGGSYGYAV